jgi:2,3-dihydroxybenzoate decarboxylase
LQDPQAAAQELTRCVKELGFCGATSGNFRTQSLTDVMLEVGADRVLYSVDYPFEDMVEAKDWFDQAAISECDRQKIARTNAPKLFHL